MQRPVKCSVRSVSVRRMFGAKLDVCGYTRQARDCAHETASVGH